MAFQKKTLRELSPLAREVAEAINECGAIERRLMRLLDHLLPTELDAQALRNKFPTESQGNATRAKLRRGKKHNKGCQTLGQLETAFHSPLPLEQALLGE